MAISKVQKQELVKQYSESLQAAKSAVVLQQNAIPVSVMVNLRKGLVPVQSKVNVVRKKLFMRALQDAGYQDVGIWDLEGSILVVFSGEDEMAPFKALNTTIKELKWDDDGSSMVYLWGRFEKDRKDADYVTELASVPSKDELLSKLVYLLNYPVQSFAATIKQIAEKDGPVEEVKDEEKKEEAAPQAPVEEKKEEAPAEEVKEEEKKEEAPVAEKKEEEKKEEAPAEEAKEE